jgi:diguanylate cyclase (GGDEF)-like protein/PAS domain S-box-containing protein
MPTTQPNDDIDRYLRDIVMHRLLQRQLKRVYGKSYDQEELSDSEKKLIELINQAYEENDKERRFIEHTLDVNSKELNEKNKTLSKTLTSLTEAQRLTRTGSWLLDLNNEVMEWSDELYRIFNFNPEEIQPSHSFAIPFIHPDDLHLTDHELEQTRDKGNFDSIYRLKLNNSDIKYVHEHREVITDKAKKPIFIQGTIQDITQQKRANEETHLYANVFKSSGEPILITDSYERIIAVNEAFIKTTGYTAEELYGKNPSILSAGETPDHIYQKMWSEINKTGFWQGEVKNRKKDGTVFPCWLSISASNNESGDILNYIGSFTDITEQKADQERIHYLAHHDSLTGLVNRFSLEERLEQAVHATKRHKNKLALFFIDMDRFKAINDTHGHQTGDELLKMVAQRLQDNIRESDIVARIGGDEFVVVITDIEEELSADPIARSLIKKLGEPYQINNKTVISSPSIGISIYPVDADKCSELMKSADAAMYHAKQSGRNNYQYFSAALNSDSNKHLLIENEIRLALENADFELFYQPQICTTDNRTCGAEALLRWEHAEKGFIPPDKFIPIAEQSGLIIPLGKWILEQACWQIQQWRDTYNVPFRVAVNISAQQLKSVDFVETVESMINKYEIEEGELELEITESTAMSDPDEAIIQLRNIRDLGVDLAIDDFGTGYSSLAYLKLLPIHTLKLDKTFVRDIESDSNDAEICSAAIALSKNLGLKVVAEGVENLTQRDFLISKKCDLLQGYYYSHPLPAVDAEKYIFEKK